MFNTFSVREVRLRGLLATGRTGPAVDLAESFAAEDGPPTPQWRVIERITTADVLARAGDEQTAADMLSAAIGDAETLRLPHQIQRIIRLAQRPGVLTGPAVREMRAATAGHIQPNPADDETVILNGGMTTQAVAHALGIRRHLTIVTNTSALIAAEVEIVLLPGYFGCSASRAGGRGGASVVRIELVVFGIRRLRPNGYGCVPRVRSPRPCSRSSPGFWTPIRAPCPSSAWA